MGQLTEFIFMLTHHDVTVPNALEVFDEVRNTGLRFVGCKDIGLTISQLEELFKRIRMAGMSSFLEIVCNNEKDHFAGIEKALHIKADYIIGGMPRFAKKTLEYLKEKKTVSKFFPYIGEVVGHPCLLKGKVEEIADQGVQFEKLGADGINLLLFRYEGDADRLLDEVAMKVRIPLVIAGNIDSYERIKPILKRNIFAFTVGGAVFERKFVPGEGIKEQVMAVLNLTRTRPAKKGLIKK